MISSIIPGLSWPAIPNQQHAALLALQFQLEQSQWWSPEKIATYQMQQANVLLAHAARTVPYYQQFLPDLLAAHHGQLDWQSWQQIPILERTAAQQHSDALVSQQIPESHLPVSAGKTSGSIGRPVELLKTRVTDLMWCALTLRGHLWHQRDLTGKLATIKSFSQQHPDLMGRGLLLDGWGPSTDMFTPKAPAVVLSVLTSVKRQLEWLCEQQPDYLLSYPSNLAALAEESLKQKLKLPHLRGVIAMGEKLTQRQRELCREAWGVDIADMYSAEEIGYIAHQRPGGTEYLVQAEHVIVEVLDANNQPCQTGEIGRVVVTTLNNFAKPLIRYAIGDYAEVGEHSPCGRGLPMLRQIMGRTRNMFVRPNGDRFWPSVAMVSNSIVSMMPRQRQYQYVQKALNEIEIRVASHEPFNSVVEEAITKKLHEQYGFKFLVSFSYVERIEVGSNFKYEEFICEI